MNYSIVLTTTATEQEAVSLARGIVGSSLAACVQIQPIRSVYRWQGGIHDESEWRLVLKTTQDRYAELERYIREHHSYQIPQIVQLPITAGLPEYLAWIDDSIRSS